MTLPLSSTLSPNKADVYFVSHGGPPSMFDTTKKHYAVWQEIGKRVLADQPRGIVMVSAHWQREDGSAGVAVNQDPANPLIYDFYGFPAHYYKENFESHSNPELTADVVSALRAGGIDVRGQKRGLDHGAWLPLKVAFGGSLDIPLVQVSLPGDDSPISATKLGKALAPLREQGYMIVASGQPVHNIRDFVQNRPAPYAAPFLSAVNTALHDPSDPITQTARLTAHPLFHHAHPSAEHFLPIVVAVAAAGAGDMLEDLTVVPDKGLGWGMWRWSSVAA